MVLSLLDSQEMYLMAKAGPKVDSLLLELFEVSHRLVKIY